MTIQDVNVVLMDMPTNLTSLVRANADDTYTIILNARMSYETRMKAYKHELQHIQNGDCEKRCSADLIEFYAHGEG